MARRAIVVDSSDGSSDEAAGSSPARRGALVDDEAEDATHAAPATTDFEDTAPLATFPQFTQLPPELRRRVWEMFCPDLTRTGRVVRVDPVIARANEFSEGDVFALGESLTLSDQTEPVRVLGAIHRESRQVCVDKFPDKLPIYAGGGDAEIRVHLGRDIILIGGSDWKNLSRMGEPPRLPPGVGDDIRHIGFLDEEADITSQGHINDDFSDLVSLFLGAFTSLQTVFLGQPHYGAAMNRRWAVSPFSCHYRVETYEKEPGLGEDLEWLYCWPNISKHPDFSSHHVLKPFHKVLPDSLVEYNIENDGVKIAPMLMFEHEGGIATFERLLLDHEHGTGIDDEDVFSAVESDDDSHPSQNEYESEGIDDSEIIEEDESSEDEIIPAPIAVDDSSETEVGDDSDAAVGATGQFSSPEPEPNEHQAPGRKRRRVVVDSDEDSDDQGPASKVARLEDAVAISDEDSDDDNDDEPILAGRTRKRPQVVSSDEDDGDGSDGEDASEEAGSRGRDDEDSGPGRLSLAERLRQFREENPVSESDGSEEDSGEDLMGDGEGSDEEDDDEDEEEDGIRGFIDDDAEETDDDSGGYISE